MAQPLTIILACDDTRNTRVFADDVRTYLTQLGIEDHRIVVNREYCLETRSLMDGSPLPMHGIAVVHGSYLRKYRTVGYVRKLAPETPDLRFIICAEEIAGERDFSDPADYAFARQHLCDRPDPQQQVCVISYNFAELLLRQSGLGMNGSLDQYIRRYIELHVAPEVR